MAMMILMAPSRIGEQSGKAHERHRQPAGDDERNIGPPRDGGDIGELETLAQRRHEREGERQPRSGARRIGKCLSIFRETMAGKEQAKPTRNRE